jgi:hypothetical protein
VTGSGAYAIWLIPTATGVRPWLVPAVIASAAIADVLVIVSLVRRDAMVGVGTAALAVGAVAMLLVPSVASATAVTTGLGPFDTPFEPLSITAVTGTALREVQDRAAVVDRTLEAFAHTARTRILFVTDSSAVAAPYILASGREVLPIGGFTGAIPEPTLEQIRLDIAFGEVRLAIVPVDPPGRDPRIVWIRTHCLVVRIDPPAAVRFGVYDCHNTAKAAGNTAKAAGTTAKA